MSAVLRVWWLFFTATPLQRWLGASGCALLALGLGGSLLTPDRSTAATLAFLGFLGFVIFTIFPAVVTTGGLLRALSAPSSHRLYPRLRPRLLLAVALLVATTAALLLGVVAPNPPPSPGFTWPGAAVAVLAAQSATIFTLFIVTRHWQWLWTIFGLYTAVPFWVNGGGPDQLRAAGFSLTVIVGALTVAAWIVFAAAYLRAARIEPIRVTPSGGKVHDGAGSAAALPRGSAVRALLGAKLAAPWPQTLLKAVAVGVAVALAFALLRFLAGARPQGAPVLRCIWPIMATFGVGALGERAVRQSRLLWLYTDGSRREILRLTEGFLARHCLFIAVVVLTAAALAPLFWRAAPLEIALVVAASVSAALCAAYLVLFALGGVVVSIVGFVTLILAQVTFLQILNTPAPVLGAVALTALQLAAAAALRFAAIRRWRAVDWLKFRPIREQRVL